MVNAKKRKELLLRKEFPYIVEYNKTKKTAWLINRDHEYINWGTHGRPYREEGDESHWKREPTFTDGCKVWEGVRNYRKALNLYRSLTEGYKVLNPTVDLTHY